MTDQNRIRYCLGMEGSANKLGIALLDFSGKIISNLRETYHAPIGEGFLPTEIGRHHNLKILGLIGSVLKESNIDCRDIKLISYTKGPGIGYPLNIVAVVARLLSLLWKAEIIGVNHCIAHIEMGRLITGAEDPIVLYASGGNTQIIGYMNNRYQIFGETMDLAVGNCLDKVARILKLPNDPSPGFNIEQEAKKWDHHEEIIQMPYTIKGMYTCFSGLLSFVKTNVPRMLEEKKWTIPQICYSLQETIFYMLAEVTERAIAHFGKKGILVVGGVGCNQRLQEIMQIVAKSRGMVLFAMDERYCIDNGAMIGYTGLIEYISNGYRGWPLSDCTITQRFRTDRVHVSWR